MTVCVLNTYTLDIEVKNINDSLESLQKEVGGLIEPFDYISSLVNNGITLYCNEEGKLLGLKPSVVILDENSAIVEYLCGNILFVGIDIASGGTKSLTKRQIALIKYVFGKKVMITSKNRKSFMGVRAVNLSER